LSQNAVIKPLCEVSVLLVEDDAMVARWVELALKGTEFRLCGTALLAEQAAELALRRRPELILTDYRLPDQIGTELVRKLRRLGIDAPVVMMTANAELGFNELAREAGAQGSILKSGDVEELRGALRNAAAGRKAFDPRHPKRRPGRAALSPRERDVLRLVAAGATNRDVADALGVSPETVKTLVARSFAKLGARRRAEAVSEAHHLGLL
jgi:DNA-binding NarL/FixJ family response regulator